MADWELQSREGYIYPWMRILKDRSSPRVYRKEFPNVVRNIKGQCLTLEPRLQQVPTPSGLPLSRRDNEGGKTSESDTDTGLYSEAEVTAWCLSMMESNYQREVLQTLSTSLC